MLELYTKDNCSTCTWAKEQLDSNHIEYVEKKLHQDISIDEIKKLFPGINQVPIIVYNGQVSDLHTVTKQLLTEE